MPRFRATGWVGFLLACALAAPAQAQEYRIPSDAGLGAAPLASCNSDLRYLNAMFGWQVGWRAEWNAFATLDQARAAARIEAFADAAPVLAAQQAALRESLAQGRTAPRVVVERVVAQIAAMIVEFETAPPLLHPETPHALQSAWRDRFSGEIVPSLAAYHRFLRDEYLPAASEEVGLASPDSDRDCFLGTVKYWTTIDTTVEEIERTGWRLLWESGAQLAQIEGRRIEALPVLLETLRQREYPGFDAEALVALSEAAIARASEAVPGVFARDLRHPVIVVPMDASLEADFPAGAYRLGNEEAPAAYIINRSRPQDRRLMAEVIAFHETLPGHHVNYGFGFARGPFNSGLVEGWAIYSEFLADELGLYSSTLDRAGMAAKHMWAASRLIVEPGLHVHGWTREQAIEFMLAHTPMSREEIEIEVDRYIALPGQSLSYMMGYDRIMGARRQAQMALGEAFDLAGFHEAVLGPGYRPLAAVERDVAAWIEDSRASG